MKHDSFREPEDDTYQRISPEKSSHAYEIDQPERIAKCTVSFSEAYYGPSIVRRAKARF